MNEQYKKDAERLSNMAKDGTKSMKRKAIVKEEMKKYSNNPNREIVTSDNREAFMAKKLGLAKEEKPVMKEEKANKPYAIYKSGSDEIISHHESEEEANKAYKKLGMKQSSHAIGELSAKERKQYGYE